MRLLLSMKEGFSPVQLLRQTGLWRVGVPGRPKSLSPPIEKSTLFDALVQTRSIDGTRGLRGTSRDGGGEGG